MKCPVSPVAAPLWKKRPVFVTIIIRLLPFFGKKSRFKKTRNLVSILTIAFRTRSFSKKCRSPRKPEKSIKYLRRLSTIITSNQRYDIIYKPRGGRANAAVVSPIGELCYKDVKYTVNGGKIGAVTQHLYDTLTGIQWGKIADPFGWTLPVD